MSGQAEPLVIEYTNWRGVHGRRRIMPLAMDFRSTKWHPAIQWLLKAFDLDSNAERDFAMADIGPRLSLVARELPPAGWIVGAGEVAAVTRDAGIAADRLAEGDAVIPFYDEATVAELDRIRRQLLVLSEGGGDHAAFALSVLEARELPQ